MTDYNKEIPQAGEKYLSFRLNGVLYGINAKYVREISVNSHIISVEYEPGFITGISPSDTTVPIINLAQKLGINENPDIDCNYLITINLDGIRKNFSIAFITCAVEGVFEILPGDDDYSSSPAQFTRKGYSRIGRRLITIIDPAIFLSEEIVRFIESIEKQAGHH